METAPQSRSGIRGPRAGPCDPSGHPAGSRLQNSGALRRDGVQVGVAATPCPSSAGRALPLNCLLPALFATMPAAGSPQTRHSRRGPEAARDTGLGRGRAVLSPEACAPPEARPRLLGSAAAGLLLLPASWLQFPHVPTEPKLRGPSKPPMCGGRRGRPQARRLPPGHPLRGADVVAKFAARVNYGGEFLFLFTSTGNQKGCLTREKVM